VKVRVLGLVSLAAMLAALLGATGCYPTAATSTTGSTSTSTGFLGYLPLIIILVLLFAMFYFLMVRPMRQREKKHDEMVSGLQVGNRVITAGGIFGEIVTMDEDSVVIKVESGATIRVTKGSIVGLRGDIQ
jgi:preprotein translocase subunit YajC